MDQERPEQEGNAPESVTPEATAPENSAPTHVAQEPTAAAPTAEEAASAGKADLAKRFIAAVIDGAISAVIGLIPIIGGLIGAAYILTRDGFDYDFMKHRSVGKQLMKLRPVPLDGKPMTLQTSIRRNWPLVFGSLTQVLLFIPVIGWLLIPLVGIAAAVLTITEIVLVISNSEGRRLGDRFANTKVIESEA
jgi:uncharacterized RDD family membrane protein YckC